VPPVPAAADLLSRWSLAPAPALLVALAGAGYLVGVQRLRERGRDWSTARSGAFAAGLVLALVATQSVIAARDDRFDVHVLQHVLLGMAAPFLLALGAPVTLTLQATARATQTRLLRILHSTPVRIAGHPLVAGGLFAFTLFGLYFSPLYGLSVHNPWIHEAVHAHFFFVGCLFFWVTVGLDPVAWKVPYGARLALVLVVVPLHGFLGLALLSTTTPLDPHATLSGALSVGALVAAQHRGAAIMWIVGDLIGLAAAGVVLAQWMRHEERRGERLDRALDAQAGDTRAEGATAQPTPTPRGPVASAPR
jgi:putative membrane protein